MSDPCIDETLATANNIKNVQRALNDPDIDENERDTIKSVLRVLMNQAETEDIQSVKHNIFDALNKLLGRNRVQEMIDNGSKVDNVIDNYVQVNEINWKNVELDEKIAFDPSTWGKVKSVAKTAGGHALDMATGGISSAVIDSVAAARGKDAGSEVENLQGQVTQQASDAEQQAGAEAQVDAAHQADIDKTQQATDQLNNTQEQEIDVNIQKIASLDQRLSSVEQLMQQVQQNMSQSAPAVQPGVS